MVESTLLRTALIYHPACLAHDTGVHVETADRLEMIMRAIAQRWGAPATDCPEQAPLEAIHAAHDADYVRTIAAIARRGGGLWDYDTVISPATYDAALFAAGAACRAVDRVLDPAGPGAAGAFALARPPGHHAGRDTAMGFCFFNNAAVAARYAQRAYGLRRVLIVDWDVHHGNGTQDIFYQDGTVAYFSTHQWPLYPGTGKWTERGAGGGEGAICNLPLPAGTDDWGYRAAFTEVLTPFARRVAPDLILISAGYDAHYADPLAQMAVSTGGFAILTGLVRDLAAELCQGRLAFLLEGGYNLNALAGSVVATLDRLNTGPGSEPALPDRPLSPAVRAALDRTIRHHQF